MYHNTLDDTTADTIVVDAVCVLAVIANNLAVGHIPLAIFHVNHIARDIHVQHTVGHTHIAVAACDGVGMGIGDTKVI